MALAVVILILLPAISMTDDLMAAQNPAEIDCCVSAATTMVPVRIPSFLQPPLPCASFAGMSFAYVRMAAPSNLPSPFVEHPCPAPIQNRPPPAA